MTSPNWIDKFLPLAGRLLAAHPRHNLPILPRSAQAALAWAGAAAAGCPVVMITDGPQSLERLHRDLLTLSEGAGARILYYPAWETIQFTDAEEDKEITGYRLDVLDQLTNLQAAGHDRTHPLIVVTDVQALMQITLTPEQLRHHSLTIPAGSEQELERLTTHLSEAGYEFEPEVVEKSRASLKGGILDIWPPTEPWPVRVEFNGTTVESIRAFDPANQRSVGRKDSVRISPAGEWRLLRKPPPEEASLLACLPDNILLAWCDMESVEEHAETYQQVVTGPGHPPIARSMDELRSAIDRHPSWREWVFQTQSQPDPSGSLRPDVVLPEIVPVPGVFRLPGGGMLPDMLEDARRRLLADLSSYAARGYSVQLFFDTTGAYDHFRQPSGQPADAPALSPQADRVQYHVGILSEGFVCDSLQLAVVAESDLYGRQKELGQRYAPRPGARATGTRLTDVADIEPGDLVVHADHGVGRYLGMREILFNGQTQEALSLEYADGVKIHLPVSQAHLLSRYIGLSRRPTSLHRLGGKRWSKEREAAQKAVMDLAATLLETQAQRKLLTGHAFQPDGAWQREFEASFPYRETQDQENAIHSVKSDMQATRPMDRLICGDAGYGKTEVAIRASFKAAIEAKQTAILVPTTVLAQQHFDTFRERMAPYPIRVEMLSRFCARGRQEEIVKDLAAGAVDIVIGTHALLQPAVRFKDLGLVIIDEEQRFGVQHKEWFKHIRRLVDVLTLTATPIPRTLYLSMTGARDMSLIQTAPRERMAIETIVAKNTDEVIREAIVREVSREGQVFFIHNRVQTIDTVQLRLRHLIPNLRLEVAHGQMPASHLEDTVKRFTRGEFDVLLCTTIVESGMDIPRANTILIDRADRFGIADLYQLRGRVGRSYRKAYAYLLLPTNTPIDPDARKRIAAVKKYSQLSTGFQLALRDLEIRGAGNLLGAEQSGHIAAVGFELYCQLLRRTVARMNDEEVPPVVDVELRLDFICLSPDLKQPDHSAVIPFAYIEDERIRLSVYRKIAETGLPRDVDRLREELTDRFGTPPPPVKRLLQMAHIRVLAAARGLSLIEVQDSKVIMTRQGQVIKEGTHFPRLTGANADQNLAQLIRLLKNQKAN